MSKSKDLVGATFRALGVSGLVASLGLAASGCIPTAAVAAGSYIGTSAAQGENQALVRIRQYTSTVCYEEDGKEKCVCGGDLFINSFNGNLLQWGRGAFSWVDCPSKEYCTECIFNDDGPKLFSISIYKELKQYKDWEGHKIKNE